MEKDAEIILEKHCPSMSNLYLDAQGRNFRDRVVKAMVEYHETEVKKLSKADVKSVCLHEWDEGSHNVHKCTKCGKYNC